MKSWLTIAASFFPELGAAVVGLIMAACANGGSGESGASNTSKLTVLAGESRRREYRFGIRQLHGPLALTSRVLATTSYARVAALHFCASVMAP
jgi:hypothetical protein